MRDDLSPAEIRRLPGAEDGRARFFGRPDLRLQLEKAPDKLRKRGLARRRNHRRGQF